MKTDKEPSNKGMLIAITAIIIISIWAAYNDLSNPIGPGPQSPYIGPGLINRSYENDGQNNTTPNDSNHHQKNN